MGLKPGLKALTPKQKNNRRANLRTIQDIIFAECDNKKNYIIYTNNKTNDLQKALIEIGAIYGENYLTLKNINVFNTNPALVVDKFFSLIPSGFIESDFVADDIDYLKKGIAIGCRRKISNNNIQQADNSNTCKTILSFMKNDTINFIDSISHEEVQILISLGRHFKNKGMLLNSNMRNIWILTGYYDSLYNTLNDTLISLKNDGERGDNNEHKIR